MKKLVFGLAIVIILGVTVMVMKVNESSTRIPYNNGFYSGAYNPNLPVIQGK